MDIKVNGKIHQLDKSYNTLLEALQGEDIWVKAPCGGLGTCGKCIVTIDNPRYISPSDRKKLTQLQLEEGIRLACTYPVSDGLTLMIGKEDLSIESHLTVDYPIDSVDETSYGCAVDIGTTTVVMAFINLKSAEIMATASFENPQKSFGADVISRISFASTKDGKDKLHSCIVASMEKELNAFIEDHGPLEKTVVACNTTMAHLLLGLDVKPLGHYPFNHQMEKIIQLDMEDLFPGLSGQLTVLPSISTFVGGDLTSGIVSLDINKKDRWQLLIDLGTNGEIILGKRNRILGTATAAGPVFEGVSLSCGIRAISGALFDVGESFMTIGDMPMTGICGTGAISLLYWLHEEEYIDETGRFDEDFQDDNRFTLKKGVYITQEDIRKLQTAKSAIRTGVDILIKSAEISTDDIETVYIAGGFGNKLNIDAFCGIGMLPQALKDRVNMVGNASLNGAAKCLLQKDTLDFIEDWMASAKGIHLNEHPDFQDLYMQYMYLKY